MAAKQILYPYDERGNLMHYARPADRGGYHQAAEWRPGEEFTATLVMDHSISGMSAKYFMWKDCFAVRWYPMFATDLVDLTQQGEITRGVTTAVWTPRKRGQNFGIRFLRDA